MPTFLLLTPSFPWRLKRWALGECAVFVKELGRRLTLVTGEKNEHVFLKQRLSIAIHRGNAMACRGTFPTEADRVE